ncbi:Signal transducing adapter molecule 1 [Daphnia magna]|uniref:Signal transducing adapter molecule 1 n=1 Tax=Daphnia magna TaxID=35525 RepID=A0A164PUD8_9CRUS|nr:Signal transducing adapter molecule 1 [Daphnia magna]
MGIFSGSSPFDQDVEKATDEKNMGDNWETILDVCDKVKAITTGPKDCLRAIIKRLYHQNPHVAKQAVILLDACVSNCNKPFHLELASRDSEQELYKLIKNKLHPQVASQLKQCLKKWAEGDFKTDSQLSLIPALYNRLKQEGSDFTGTSDPVKKVVIHNSDVAAKEEEDIAKAIALSLKEAEVTTKVSSSLYPSMATAAPVSPVKERRKVRALYDFEAAEDNELTFKAGEIIHVIDDSDPNWWKGSNQRGEGLFPANFVSTDLDAEPEIMVARETSKRVQFNEQVVVATLEETASSEAEIEIDEAKIDRMLHALHEADPTGERNDPEELKVLEDQCGAMGPLIDAELEKLDRRHAHLTKLGSHLIESLDMYRSLMREMPAAPQSHGNIAMGMPGPGYQYTGISVGSTVQPGGAMHATGAMKYPFPQPQAPPQSPSLAPFAPPGGHPAPFPPNQVPNPMPYGVVNMGQQPFVNPYSGHPPNF